MKKRYYVIDDPEKSDMSVDYLKSCGQDIHAVIDKNLHIQGTNIDPIAVCLAEWAFETRRDYLFIATKDWNFYNELKQQLIPFGSNIPQSVTYILQNHFSNML